MTDPSPASRTAGSQTLARGIAALQAIAGSRDGLSIQDVAARLDVHRTIAYRILNTLADANLVHKNDDGHYRGAAGLLGLATAAHSAMRAAALPVLADLANQLESTVALLVREGPDAVALAVVEPRGVDYHISFAEGSRHPLDQGAAGHAIRACYPPSPNDAQAVVQARELGYAVTYGEIVPGMFGLAAPIPGSQESAAACINLITTRRDLVDTAVPPLRAAAERITARLA